MDNNDSNGFNRFLDSISFLKERISLRRAYLGVIAGFAVFLFSLFLAWTKARDASDVIDSGISTGWSELGYISVIPLLLMLYKILRNKTVSIITAVFTSLLSLVLLIYDNVVSRSTWISHTQCSDGDCTFGHNYGSDLGGGFWIGLIAILVISACSISWAFHKNDYRKSNDVI